MSVVDTAEVIFGDDLSVTEVVSHLEVSVCQTNRQIITPVACALFADIEEQTIRLSDLHPHLHCYFVSSGSVTHTQGYRHTDTNILVEIALDYDSADKEANIRNNYFYKYLFTRTVFEV